MPQREQGQQRRILQIYHAGDYVGGATRSTTTLVLALAKSEEYDVVAVVPTSKDKTVLRELQENGIATYEMHVPWAVDFPTSHSLYARFRTFCKRRINFLYGRHAERKISKIIKAHDIDIVHISDAVIDCGFTAAHTLGKPVVWHMREYVEKDHGLIYIDKDDLFKKYSMSTVLVFVSESLKTYYAKMLSGPCMAVVYNGIAPFEEIALSSPQIVSKDGDMRIIFKGGLSKKKGIEDVIGAAQALLESGFDRFEIDVYGSLFDWDADSFAARMRDLGLEDRVRYKGWQEFTLASMRDYDVSLTCSVSEAFGRVTAEAMAAGILVIGANAGATKELLEGERGLLYQPGVPEDLAANIISSSQTSEECDRCRFNAHEFAAANFSIETYVESVKRIYERISINMENSLR